MSKDIQKLLKSQEEDAGEWISISDIMTTLMIIFLFVSILYIKRVQNQIKEIKQANEMIKQASQEYVDHQKMIYESLQKEFSKDLKKWEAELLKDPVIIRFLSPDIMFLSGKSSLQPRFKKILQDFCPRYFSVLSQFKKSIEEIRIEGHTSFEWYGAKTKTDAYFKNMKLSQGRTRSVLQYCVTFKGLNRDIKSWATNILTANGLSSSKPLCLETSANCRARNRRVEFRLQADRDTVLNTIRRNLPLNGVKAL